MLPSQIERLAVEQGRQLSIRKQRKAKKYAEFSEIIELKRKNRMQYELEQQALRTTKLYDLLEQDLTLTQCADRLHITKAHAIELLKLQKI